VEGNELEEDPKCQYRLSKRQEQALAAHLDNAREADIVGEDACLIVAQMTRWVRIRIPMLVSLVWTWGQNMAPLNLHLLDCDLQACYHCLEAAALSHSAEKSLEHQLNYNLKRKNLLLQDLQSLGPLRGDLNHWPANNFA
jgi:hypothetical protein